MDPVLGNPPATSKLACGDVGLLGTQWEGL